MTGMIGTNVPSVKPNSDRRNTMKTSTKDQAEGKDEKRAGKVQKKIGQVEKVLGK